MKPYYNSLPDVEDLSRLKTEISQLTERESDISDSVKPEFRRQLFEIRNLHRLIRFEILDPRNQGLSPFAGAHANSLYENWNVLKANMSVARSHCD